MKYCTRGLIQGPVLASMNDMSMKPKFLSKEETYNLNQEKGKDNGKCLISDNAFSPLLTLSQPCKESGNYMEVDSAVKSNTIPENNNVQRDEVNITSPTEKNKYNLCTSSQICKRVLKFIRKENKTVKIWECGICGKEFQHQYTLMRHFPTHTGERKYKCEDCGKAFRQKSTLSQHQVIHSEARPYVCGLCKKTFNRASTLKSHHVTHSDKKPHVCPFCGKGFHQKGNLRNHIFVHTEERPYKCNICGKGFNQMSNLMSHKQHSHGNTNPYVCNICHKEFPRKYVLRSHEEYVHRIKYKGGIYINGMDKIKKIEGITNNVTSSDTNQKHHNGNINHVSHLPERKQALKDSCATSSPDHQSVRKGEEHEFKMKTDCPSIIIDPIKTKAMLSTRYDGRTPIALLKTTLEDSVLVKVVDTEDMKQMLVPATAQDLKAAGTITTVKSFNALGSRAGKINAIQIKVPIVATVVQKSSVDGRSSIEVELPSSRQEMNCPQEIMESNGSVYSNLASESHPSLNCTIQGSSDLYIREANVFESTYDEKICGSSTEVLKGDITANIPEWSGAEQTSYEDEKRSNDCTFQSIGQEELKKGIQQYTNTKTAETGCKLNKYIIPDCPVALMNIKNSNRTSAAVHSIGCEMRESEKKLFVNTSENEEILVECNPEHPALQHILYEESEKGIPNSEESRENLIINPLRYVLNEAQNVYVE